MTQPILNKPEPLTRWVVERLPVEGAICIQVGDSGWARLQQRELVGFEKHGLQMKFQYSPWTEIIVEAPPQLLQAGVLDIR